MGCIVGLGKAQGVLAGDKFGHDVAQLAPENFLALLSVLLVASVFPHIVADSRVFVLLSFFLSFLLCVFGRHFCFVLSTGF